MRRTENGGIAANERTGRLDHLASIMTLPTRSQQKGPAELFAWLTSDVKSVQTACI